MKYTVMSYHMDPDGGSAYPLGLQQFDIAALQEMYGVNYATRSEDTTYTFNSSPGILTIWDGGGKDKIDSQAISGNVVIDLQPGHFSSIGGTKNVAMALVSHLPETNKKNPLIENAKSGTGNDELTGNDAKNILEAGGGLNKLYGRAGDDILVSEGLRDILDGGIGNDALINHEYDGNNQYIFGKGYGHDGIIDAGLNVSGVDIHLKDLTPADIEIVVKRFDYTGNNGYIYGNPWIKVLDTGDTLLLNFAYREGIMISEPI